MTELEQEQQLVMLCEDKFFFLMSLHVVAHKPNSSKGMKRRRLVGKHSTQF